MGRRGFNLAFGMELILAAGVGLFFVKTKYEFYLSSIQPFWRRPWFYLFYQCGGGFLAGTIVVLGSGLLIEVVTKRPPGRWGWGRVTLSMDFLNILVYFVSSIFIFHKLVLRTSPTLTHWVAHFDSWTYLGPTTVAALATWRIGLRSGEPVLDAREMAARIVFVVALLMYVFITIGEAIDR